MYDVAILGGGPGGYVAAAEAAALGLKTILVERDKLGGTCLNRGCIPTKSLLNSAKIYRHARHAQAMGVNAGSIEFDLGTAMSWKNNTVTRLVANIDFMLKKQGVTIRQGSGRLAGPGIIEMQDNGETIEAKHIILATGSVPSRPPIPGSADNAAVLTSDELLEIGELPASLAVIGGGVIGIEFASFFASLGTKVTVVELLPEILPFLDAEAVGVFKRSLKGIELHTGSAVKEIRDNTVFFTKDGTEGSVSADRILLATGRSPVVEGIGLETCGIRYSRRGIEVDDQCRTNIANIFAIGDVNGRSLLAHSASAMGKAVARQIARQTAGAPGAAGLAGESNIPWEFFPWVVYGDPEVAGVGNTEQDLQKRDIPYRKAVVPARANGRFLAEQGMSAHGMCKILSSPADGRVLGVHVVSPYAGEMIWGMQFALQQGATVEELERAVFPHPTVSELMHDTLGALLH